MTRIIRTLDGDTLDLILWRELGGSTQIADCLALNPHLADLGPILPAGLPVRIPDAPAPAERDLIRLWSAP